MTLPILCPSALIRVIRGFPSCLISVCSVFSVPRFLGACRIGPTEKPEGSIKLRSGNGLLYATLASRCSANQRKKQHDQRDQEGGEPKPPASMPRTLACHTARWTCSSLQWTKRMAE